MDEEYNLITNKEGLEDAWEFCDYRPDTYTTPVTVIQKDKKFFLIDTSNNILEELSRKEVGVFINWGKK